MKSLVGYVLAALLIAVGVVAYNQYIVETDNFYHLAHSRFYWENGIMDTQFPYGVYSIINEKQSDLWWGFHVLLAPLALIQNKTLMLAVAPGVLIFLYLLICRGVMCTLKINPWYGLALLPASSGFFARMYTVRPQSLSAPLFLLVFAGFAANSPLVSILAAAAVGFIHPTLSYMIVLLAIASLFAKAVVRSKTKPIAELVAPLVAMAVACLRPNLIQGLELLKIQLYDLFIVRRAGEVKNFGGELTPVNKVYFLSAMLAPIIVLAICCLLAIRGNKSKSASHAPSSILSGFIICLASAAIMVFITKRGVDQFAPFTVLLGILVAHRTGGLMWLTAVIFAGNSGWSIGNWAHEHWKRKNKNNSEAFKSASEWLAAHTKPGDIVGNMIWSDYGALVFWNPENRYLGGMDPVFQYRFNPETYWLMTLTPAGRELGQTSRYNPLKEPGKEEMVSIAWPRDLKTQWLVVGAKSYETFQGEFKKDPNVQLVYQDEGAHVYHLGPIEPLSVQPELKSKGPLPKGPISQSKGSDVRLPGEKEPAQKSPASKDVNGKPAR